MSLNFESFLSLALITSGMAMVWIGMSAQVLKNYKEKRCGNPLSLIFLAIIVYLSRMLYSYFVVWAPPILMTDSMGFIVSLVLLGQWRKYR